MHVTVVLAVFAKAAVAALTAVLCDYALFGKLMLTLQIGLSDESVHVLPCQGFVKSNTPVGIAFAGKAVLGKSIVPCLFIELFIP